MATHDDARAQLYAREHLAQLGWRGREDSDVILESLARAFGDGLLAGRDEQRRNMRDLEVQHRAADYAMQGCGESADLRIAILVAAIASAWYVGYHAGVQR